MNYDELLEVIDEKITEHKIYMEDDLRHGNYGMAASHSGFVSGLSFVKETIECWQMETRR